MTGIEVLISETRGAFSSTKVYQVCGNGNLVEIRHQQQEDNIPKQLRGGGSKTVGGYAWFVQKCLITLRQVFLPSGYPESVSGDYMTYQLWDTVQAFSSSITGSLATEAVMRGVGVGDENATTLAATMTWLVKSGSGMIGQILFAWWKGTALDHDNKKWRLFADVLNDFSTFIDLITPWFPSSVIMIMFSCSSVGRAIVGVCGGGTRAAIIQHQSKANNSAEVSSKDGSQETLVNLVSLLVCLALLPAVSGKTALVWSLFAFFTWLHVYSNYKAVKSLQLETFNKNRLLLCLKQYFENGRVPSIRSVNKEENVIIGFGIKDTDLCQFRIRMGVSVEEAFRGFRYSNEVDAAGKQVSKGTLNNILKDSRGRAFLIVPKKDSKEICIVLHENVSDSDLIEAYVRAVLFAYSFTKGEIDSLDVFQDSITNDWEIFRNCVLAEGFSCSIALLEAGDWRAKWKKHV